MPDHASRAPLIVHRALRAVEAVLDRERVRDEAVLLGVSGGSDSTALLVLMAKLASRRELRLHVACIDHGTRREAQDEALFVAATATRLGARFHSEAVSPAGEDEDSMRRVRLDALSRIADREGCRLVLLGHNADDQIETIVFRFVRGAGLGGLAGMRERRGRYLRPLLSLRRAELRSVLQAEGADWRDDPTNDTNRYARGRLRRGVLPAIEAAFGNGALEHLLDVAPRWRADEDLLEREAARLLSYASRRSPHGVELEREALVSGERALRSRALRRWVRDSGGRRLEARQLAVVERWLDGLGARGNEGRQRVDLPGLVLEHDRGRLRLRIAAGAEGNSDGRRIDSAASSDDPFPASSRRPHDAALSPEEAVLPPSGGRVRVRRK